MDDSEQPNTDSKTTNVVNLLKQFSANGLSFEQAKEKLISQGFTESQITSATDQYTYGLKFTSDIPTKTADYFKAHPEEAVADGSNLLKAQHKEDLADERTQAVLDAAAADAASKLGVGNADAEVEYESKFAFDVGISFWLLVVIGILVNVIAFLIVTKFHIDSWFYVVNGLLTLFIVVILIKRMK